MPSRSTLFSIAATLLTLAFVALVAFVPGCSPAARARFAESMRPACEAIVVAIPHAKQTSAELSMSLNEYAAAICAVPGIASALEVAVTSAQQTCALERATPAAPSATPSATPPLTEVEAPR